MADFNTEAYARIMRPTDHAFNWQWDQYRPTNRQDYIRIVAKVRGAWPREVASDLRVCNEHIVMGWDWFEHVVAQRVEARLEQHAGAVDEPRARLFVGYLEAMTANMNEMYYEEGEEEDEDEDSSYEFVTSTSSYLRSHNSQSTRSRIAGIRHNLELQHNSESHFVRERQRLEREYDIIMELVDVGSIHPFGNMEFRIMDKAGRVVGPVKHAIGFSYIGETAVFYQLKN
jgi:hypothetical protein